MMIELVEMKRDHRPPFILNGVYPAGKEVPRESHKLDW